MRVFIECVLAVGLILGVTALLPGEQADDVGAAQSEPARPSDEPRDTTSRAEASDATSPTTTAASAVTSTTLVDTDTDTDIVDTVGSMDARYADQVLVYCSRGDISGPHLKIDRGLLSPADLKDVPPDQDLEVVLSKVADPCDESALEDVRDAWADDARSVGGDLVVVVAGGGDATELVDRWADGEPLPQGSVRLEHLGDGDADLVSLLDGVLDGLSTSTTP